MEFEWDEAKRLANLARHNLDFVDVWRLFDGRQVLTLPTPRADELRFLTIGPIGPKFYTVVWTERGPATRLISFRRARNGEEQSYCARFG